MAAETALKLTLIGTDKSASKALHGVERSAKGVTNATSKIGSMGKAAMLGLAGGLLIAVPEEKAAGFQAEADSREIPMWQIGSVAAGSGITVLAS